GRSLVPLLVAVASCAELEPSTFRCASDAACVRQGIAGTCEASGFCSYPDVACASGRRFDEFAAAGLAGTCRTLTQPPPDAAPPIGPSLEPCALVSCPNGTCRAGACCDGCWNGTSCRPGTEPAACGSHGVACAACSASEICGGGACVSCNGNPCTCGG